MAGERRVHPSLVTSCVTEQLGAAGAGQLDTVHSCISCFQEVGDPLAQEGIDRAKVRTPEVVLVTFKLISYITLLLLVTELHLRVAASLGCGVRLGAEQHGGRGRGQEPGPSLLLHRRQVAQGGLLVSPYSTFMLQI